MQKLFELARADLAKLFSKSNHSKDVRELQNLFTMLKLEEAVEMNAAISRLPTIWLGFLNLDSDPTKLKFKDRPAQICLLSALYQIDLEFSADVGLAFKKAGAWYERSIAELKLRLSARLYKYARRIWRDFKNKKDTAACLEYSLKVSDLRVQEFNSLNDGTKKVLYGFRGASREIIGRIRETDFNFWELAYQDMKRSFELGNRSAEAKEFLRGIAVTRFVKHNTMEHYDDAVSQFEKGYENDSQKIGEFVQVAAAAAPRLALTSPASAILVAEKAERFARKALSMPTIGSEPTQIPFLKQQRAFLSMVIIQNNSEISEEKLEALLNENISDFEIGLSAGLGGTNLSHALLRRASLRVEQGRLHEAKADLRKSREMLPDLTETNIKVNVEKTASAIETRIHFDSCFQKGDYSAAIRAAATSNKFLPNSYHNFFEYLTKLRSVIESPLFTPTVNDRDTLKNFLQSISETPESIEPASSVEFILSYAASLSRALDGLLITRLTLNLYRQANEAATVNKLEISSFAANMFLQAGKQEDDIGEIDRSILFEESISLFEECLALLERGAIEYSDAFLPRVVYSKAGEAHLRFAKYLLPKISSYERAFVLFWKSVELGNSAPEVFGLLGDAKYRIAIGKSSEVEFEAALNLKAQARKSGSRSRENYSVSARISDRLFQLRKDSRLLSDALEFSVKSIEVDQNWSWPYIQIWEAMKKYRKEWPEIFNGANIVDILEPEFHEKIQACDADYIIEEGIRKTIQSDEFQRKNLGGRSNVFLIDDPHGLLGTTVVLKPTSSADAQRETAEAIAVNKLIETAGKKDMYSVIEPICTIYDQSRYIMAMRYAQGGTLAQRILKYSATGKYIPTDEMKNVAEFLALFHRPSLNSVNGFEAKGLSQFLKGLRDIVGRKQLERSLECMGTIKLPEVRKKDAHAENWILDVTGRVTMLDLEARRKQPLLADLSQLLDDFPACAPTEAGWRKRELIAESYVAKLDVTLGREFLLRPYLELFAIWRASVMLPSITRKKQKEYSISSLKSFQTRQIHLTKNMKYLSTEASFPEMAKMAQMVTDEFSGAGR